MDRVNEGFNLLGHIHIQELKSTLLAADTLYTLKRCVFILKRDNKKRVNLL